MRAFALDEGVVYHTHSARAGGLDGLWGMYQWLDRAPLGRNEKRAPDDPLNSFRRHDEYDRQRRSRQDAPNDPHGHGAEAAIYRRLATTTMLFVLVSPCSNAQVTRTTRLRTVLSDAHAGSALAVFGDSPVLSIW